MRNVSPTTIIRRLHVQWVKEDLRGYAGRRLVTRSPEPFRPLEYSVQVRGAKRKANIHIESQSEPLSAANGTVPIVEDVGRAYPTVVQQARSNMRKHENCVLLTRVGSFYELYFEHADKYGPLLNLKVAQKKTAAGPVSMSGFPFYQLDRFLKILVQDLHEFVAVSEEFPNNVSETIKSGGLLFDRKVTRIVTPGTLIDEKFVDPYENHFLLALHPTRWGETDEEAELAANSSNVTKDPASSSRGLKPVGLAWLDLSTGDFFTQVTTLDRLPSAVARIGPKEIILSKSLGEGLQHAILRLLELKRHLVTFYEGTVTDMPVSSWNTVLETEMPLTTQSAFSGDEIAAGSVLIHYVQNRLQALDIRLQAPLRKPDSDNMIIDKNSMKALEVLGTSKEGRGGGKGSLLHTMRRTVTKSGARLLRDRIASPSMSLQTINARLDLVSLLFQDRAFREDIVTSLRQSYDCQRLVQKFSLGRGDADDLVSLLRTIKVFNGIADRLESQILQWESKRISSDGDRSLLGALRILRQRLHLDGPNTLADLINAAIDEEGLERSRHTDETGNTNMVSSSQDAMDNIEDPTPSPQMSQYRMKQTPSSEQDFEEQDAWILRKSASPLLEQIHAELRHLHQDKTTLSRSMKQKLNTPSLTLRWTPGSGYVCHVKGARDVAATTRISDIVGDVKTTKSTRSFYHPEWSSLGSRIDQAKSRVRAEEQRVFRVLREEVVTNLVTLRQNAKVLDELDIGCSFATLAEEQNLIRPVLNQGLEHKIIKGRHPCVTQGLEAQGRAFVSNDCLVGNKERIWLITGPNMAGKSTFLRQNALISVLAQTGSFVPAEAAEIGLVDRIFTRVGSADDLFQDQSTFMVEMLETAAILTQATPQSFVIMDEIGRGTSPEDGIAVGFACLHHLYHKVRCRTLFATHFHALANMTKDFEHLACYCTDVVEEPEGSFSFVHRLRKGVNKSSHALKVARLAGVPNTAIEIAKTVLLTFEAKAQHVD